MNARELIEQRVREIDGYPEVKPGQKIWHVASGEEFVVVSIDSPGIVNARDKRGKVFQVFGGDITTKKPTKLRPKTGPLD